MPPSTEALMHLRSSGSRQHFGARGCLQRATSYRLDAPATAIPSDDALLLPAGREAPGTVLRQTLVHRLESLPPQITLVGVVAPSGYGKTTLLRQWTGSSTRPPAWLSLRSEHHHPAVLLAGPRRPRAAARPAAPGRHRAARRGGLPAAAGRAVAAPAAARGGGRRQPVPAPPGGVQGAAPPLHRRHRPGGGLAHLRPRPARDR